MQHLPRQTHAIHHTGLEVLHDHIGAGEEAHQFVDALRALEIDGDAFLVAVGTLEISAIMMLRIVTAKRPEGAGGIAVDRLDLDDIRAEAQKEGMAAMAQKYREGGDLYMAPEALEKAGEQEL